MADCGLDLVARTDDESLIKVTCARCQDSRMIAVQVAAEVEAKPFVSVRDEPLTAAPVIATDDVLDVRLHMSRHAGDLTSLLSSVPDR
jgi:hypothetical protein